jgi:epoxyqueuosine reductase
MKTDIASKNGNENLAKSCLAELERRGWKARCADIGRLDDIEADILRFRDLGAITPSHFAYLMACWDFTAARSFAGGASLIVIARPSPLRRLSFTLDGKAFEAFLPPIFAERSVFEEEACAALNGLLKPDGHRAISVHLPEKLFAARTGLARIGRNRISYIDGMGSFARLGVFLSDLDFHGETWDDVGQPESCSACGACERACPPRIIKNDGSPLPYDKCLCYFNEETDGPFPPEIDPKWHNAIIGCMRCQETCPLDAPFLKAARPGPVFSEAETRAILEGKGDADRAGLSPELSGKLAECGLLYHWPQLPRNLRALAQSRIDR